MTMMATKQDPDLLSHSQLDQLIREQEESGMFQDDRRYACDKCSYRAMQPYHLKRHKESKHEGIRYQCEQCAYSATRVDKLKLHKQSIHEGIRYTCDQCGFSTPRMDRLKHHKRTKH